MQSLILMAGVIRYVINTCSAILIGVEKVVRGEVLYCVNS